MKGPGIVGAPELKEIAEGRYVQVSIPLFYVSDKDNPDNRVDASVDAATLAAAAQKVTDLETAKANGLSTFFARWNLRPDWFTDEFVQNYKAGLVDEKEKVQYRINLAKLTKHLFKALGQEPIDFEAVTAGSIVGFKASGSKKEPDRLQIQDFYAIKQ